MQAKPISRGANDQELFDRFLSVTEVTRILGISRTTLYSWLGQQLLPKQRRIGPRRVGFLGREIAEFVQSRKAA